MKLLRLLCAFIGISCSGSMMFRFELWSRFLMDAFFYIMMIVYYKLIFLHTPALGGFDADQALVFVAVVCVLDAVQMTFFGHGMWRIVQDVNSGSFDFFLLRPTSPLFSAVFRWFSLASAFNLILALSILAWSIVRLPVIPPLSALLSFVFFLVLGIVLWFCIRLIFVSVVFWSGQAMGVLEAFFSLYPLIETPDAVFSKWTRRLLLTFVPFGLMASLPARAFIHGLETGEALLAILVTVLFIWIARICWLAGLRVYGSASS